MSEPIKVDIWKLRYFRDQKALQRLNDHAAIHSDFNLHQISGATGCNRETAILVLKYAQLAGALRESTAFYDMGGTILCIAETFPDLPFEYQDDCGKDCVIENMDQLLWVPFYVVSDEAKSRGWSFFNSK